MKQRAIIIFIAILLGLTASYMVTNYANSAKNEALKRVEPVDVLVVAKKTPIGLTLDELRDRKLVETKSVPKEFVAEDAVKPDAELNKKVLAAQMSSGEQLTGSKFKIDKKAGLAFTVPKDMTAVAIPIDDMKAAGNLIKIGDYINVVGTAKLSGDEENAAERAMTKTILQKVQVLAVGRSLENIESNGSIVSSAGSGAEKSSKTVTLALTQADAEKLIFMQDQGRIWLTLLPSKKADVVTTNGQTAESVFQIGEEE